MCIKLAADLKRRQASSRGLGAHTTGGSAGKRPSTLTAGQGPRREGECTEVQGGGCQNSCKSSRLTSMCKPCLLTIQDACVCHAARLGMLKGEA